MMVYIAGPIKGYPSRNIAAFREMEAYVATAGHVPVVPHDITPATHEGECPEGYDSFGAHTSACYLRADLLALLRCDAIKLLQGHENSRGASLELAVAMNTGIRVFKYEEPLP